MKVFLVSFVQPSLDFNTTRWKRYGSCQFWSFYAAWHSITLVKIEPNWNLPRTFNFRSLARDFFTLPTEECIEIISLCANSCRWLSKNVRKFLSAKSSVSLSLQITIIYGVKPYKNWLLRRDRKSCKSIPSLYYPNSLFPQIFQIVWFPSSIIRIVGKLVCNFLIAFANETIPDDTTHKKRR
jgi:hypothetical protein